MIGFARLRIRSAASAASAVLVCVFAFAARAEVLPDDGFDFNHSNKAEEAKLNPDSCKDGFSFAVMGDNQGSRKVFEFLVDLVDEMKPDFAYSVGDVTENGFVDEYKMYLTQIRGTKVPWFVVPGNHEYRDPGAGISMEKQRRFEKIFGPSDFMFDHCGWRFIGLDVVAFDSLRPGQMKKLEKALKGREGRSAVFMHYPPSIVKNWEEGIWKQPAEEFMALLDKYKARYFFSGHIHLHDRMQIGPTAYIVTGGSGGGLDLGRSPANFNSTLGGAYYHFIYVKVDGDEATDIIVRPNIPPDKKEDWSRLVFPEIE